MGDAVAAVDCGTNTLRLLIQRDGVDLVRTEIVTRLGAGLDRTGRVDPTALDRLAAAATSVRRDLDRHGVASPTTVTTAAARSAGNSDELIDVLARTLSAEPRVIGGEEEASLSFAGATRGLDPADGPFCVIDIGGGSTEFAVGTSAADQVMSVEMGSVRFTERYIETDPPSPEELLACLSVAETHLSDVVREMPQAANAATYLAVAGTAVTVAAVEIGCEPDDRDSLHGFELTHAAAEDVFRTLATESLADRRHNPGLHPDRAEVIVGGSALLVATMRFLSIDPVVVSTHDLLDALLAEQT
jgi:exopolyphosphatase/guanosine-5'-triphosphate,3'-diphosphate pyrophosphatase